ncbi:glycosyltransferase [Polynucleobacter paneuropaeus]|nr:glycosyltransferase [Polynucleobacter paneuropaeus]
MSCSLNNPSSSGTLLSIVTVVRNDASRLMKTVKSLRAYYDDLRFEHIVIDGASTDETLEVVKNISKYKNVKTISELDNGIYDGMNKAVYLSSGKFLLFLNCGDEMVTTPSKTFYWLDRLSTIPMDIVCFPCLVSKENDSYILKPSRPKKWMTPTSHQAMLFAYSFIRDNLYDASYKISADFDLYLRADKDKVIIFPDMDVLTAIEPVGFASENPILAYREYFQIVDSRFSGLIKYLLLIRIIFKAAVVIVVKNIAPKYWVYKLRKFL